MPRILPIELIAVKNLLYSNNPWILLAKVTINTTPDPIVIYLARNNENVIFQGDTYVAYNFELGDVQSSKDGSLPTLTLKVSNISRSLDQYLDLYDGFVNSDITLHVVSAGHLGSDYSELSLDYKIVGNTSSNGWVEFILGFANPLLQRFPLLNYVGVHCNWVRVFRGVECKYAGADTTCDGTLEACIAKNNQRNFGGYPGVNSYGIRIV